MMALQLHYTSCQAGLLGSPGFQTRAISDGIVPEERVRIERMGFTAFR